MNRKECKKEQGKRAVELESPASILCRWKNDPNPCGVLENSNQEDHEIIKIRKIEDVDRYMDVRFGFDSKNK